jgi:hypothetical protein
MKDAKGHGSNPRGGPTSPRAERVKLNKQLDQRKIEPPSTRPWGPARPEHQTPLMSKLQAQYGSRTPSAAHLRDMIDQSGAHTSGVHTATAGKTLAHARARGSVGTFKGGTP